MSGLSQPIRANAERQQKTLLMRDLMTLIMLVSKKAHVLIDLAWMWFMIWETIWIPFRSHRYGSHLASKAELYFSVGEYEA